MLDSVVPLLVPVVTVLAATLPSRFGTSPARRRIEQNVDLLDRLPESSTVRSKLIAEIDRSIDELLIDERTKTRSATGIAIALAFVIGAGVLLWFAGRSDSWTQWVLLVVALVCLVLGFGGLAIDGQRVARDKKGRPVRISDS